MGRHSAARSRRAGTGFRRLRALLAGGLVLGVGATLTLAAWNDNEYATGSFEASVFSIEGSTDGSTFAEHPTSGTAAVLSFAATAMSPGVSHYALFDIRTTAATTVAGTVALNSSDASGTLSAALEYRTVLIGAGATCDATAFGGTPTWIAGGASAYLDAGTMPGSTPTTLIAAAGGQTLRYCFDVRVTTDAANSYQGATADLTWGFAATSND